MALTKFLRHFAGEYRQIGSALLTLAAGIALQPREREEVNNAVSVITNAADNIEKSLKTLKEATPNKAMVTAAVKDLLPDMLAGMVEAQVRAALEAKAKTTDT
jgi:hypothetical protein